LIDNLWRASSSGLPQNPRDRMVFQRDAWDEELRPGAMVRRVLLNEPIVMFRDSQGAVHAMRDRCPHRFAPLHLGLLDGDTVQCRYHGLKFSSAGECVHNPHGPIPRAAKVQVYPTAETHSMIWIWMGEAEKADPRRIPDFSFQDPERFFVGKEYLHVRSGYLLEVDNIMDLSHTEFMHPTTLGSSGISKGKFECKQDGSTVWSNRLTNAEIMNGDLCEAMGVPRGVPVDRWINVRWDAPANMAIFAGAVPAGRPQEEGRNTPTAHCFTPETDSTTHYWFSICFSKSLGDIGAQMARDQIQYVKAPFQMEDLPMLEMQQQNMGGAEFWSLKPVLLSSDAAGVRARRALDKLIGCEQEAAARSEKLAANQNERQEPQIQSPR
jgi:phenylpropionate dioxygenase-like ring-hydroxylating dioxygenase large terminal subunit